MLAALIGNHVLTTADLAAFHTKLVPDLETDKVRIKIFDKKRGWRGGLQLNLEPAMGYNTSPKTDILP